MRKFLPLALLALAAPGAASFNQDPLPLSDAEVLKLVSQDDRMTVPVEIGHAAGQIGGPWNFIIDTGAQRTVISRELANVLKLPRGRDVMLTAMTGRSLVTTAVIPSLRVGTFGGEGIEAPALAARHLGAPGLLGIDTLQGRKVSIDFERQTMAVSPSERRSRSRPARAPNEIVIQAKSYLGQLVVGDATYRGTPIRVVLDTGTAVSIGNAALKRLVAQHTPKQLEITSVTGQAMQVGYTQLDRVGFGGLTISNLPVAFAAAAPFQRFKLEKRPALLLGMDALGLFRRVDIDFANRELRLLRPKG